MIINLKNTNIKPAAVLLPLSFALSIVGYLYCITYIAYAQNPSMPGIRTETNPGNLANASSSTMASNSTNQSVIAGRIASLVNAQTGKPTSILSGNWKMLMPTEFEANITMVNPDGLGSHRHRIQDFKVTGNSVVNTEDLKSMNGTSTLTMPEGTPFKHVPTSVKLMNNNSLTIVLDPNRTGSHFGNTPIYGVIR